MRANFQNASMQRLSIILGVLLLIMPAMAAVVSQTPRANAIGETTISVPDDVQIVPGQVSAIVPQTQNKGLLQGCYRIEGPAWITVDSFSCRVTANPPASEAGKTFTYRIEIQFNLTGIPVSSDLGSVILNAPEFPGTTVNGEVGEVVSQNLASLAAGNTYPGSTNLVEGVVANAGVATGNPVTPVSTVVNVPVTSQAIQVGTAPVTVSIAPASLVEPTVSVIQGQTINTTFQTVPAGYGYVAGGPSWKGLALNGQSLSGTASGAGLTTFTVPVTRDGGSVIAGYVYAPVLIAGTSVPTTLTTTATSVSTTTATSVATTTSTAVVPTTLTSVSTATATSVSTTTATSIGSTTVVSTATATSVSTTTATSIGSTTVVSTATATATATSVSTTTATSIGSTTVVSTSIVSPSTITTSKTVTVSSTKTKSETVTQTLSTVSTAVVTTTASTQIQATSTVVTSVVTTSTVRPPLVIDVPTLTRTSENPTIDVTVGSPTTLVLGSTSAVILVEGTETTETTVTVSANGYTTFVVVPFDVVVASSTQLGVSGSASPAQPVLPFGLGSVGEQIQTGSSNDEMVMLAGGALALGSLGLGGAAAAGILPGVDNKASSGGNQVMKYSAVAETPDLLNRRTYATVKAQAPQWGLAPSVSSAAPQVAVHQLNTSYTLTQPVPRGRALARTGVNTVTAGVLALVLVVAGVTLTLVNRRREGA